MVGKSLFTRPIVVWMLVLVTLMCACSAVMAASAPSLGRALMTPSAPSLGRVPIIPIPKDKLNQWSCAKQYRIIGNNKALFNLTMKQHLSEADRLILSRDIEDKRRGLGIALAVALAASDRNLNNGSTAANICDRYLIPKQALGLSANWECLSKEAILTKAVAIYEKSGQSGKVVSTGKMWLRYNSTGNSADAIRVKMASALIKQGKKSEAASYLKQISDKSSLAGAKSWIPGVGFNTKAATAARDGAGLVEAFTNMADASLADVKEEASREATGSCTKYSNVPVAVPFSEKFGGGFTPYSDDTQLAVCSDAPAKVYIDGELVLDIAGKPGTAYVVPIKWKKDKLYGVDIEYSKSSRSSSAVGGATMFAYNGGGELSIPLMLCEASGSAGTIIITSKIQITGGGPCILSAELITQEITGAHTTTEISRYTVTPYAENGYWVAKFNWNTCDGDHNTTNPVTHNGNYATKVIWRNIIDPHNPIVIATDPGTATVNNLVITSVSPDLVSWPGGTTSTTVSASYTDGDTPAKTASLSAPNVVSDRTAATTSVQGTPGATGCTFNLTGAQSSKELYTCEATISHGNDSTTYRSTYLTVSGVSVTYVSHDNNGTPDDPSDDKENYSVTYTLADTKGRAASAGDLRLYNPNKISVGILSLSGSQLDRGVHQFQFAIPESSLPLAGEYTLVVHVQDSDGPEYRDHKNRLAPDVGGTFNVDWSISISKCAESWLPTGKEGQAGTTTITATLHPSGTEGVINFEFSTITNWPGYCCNAGAESGYDLKLDAQTGFNINPAKTWAATQAQVEDASITVSCYDYGAWGKITAYVTINGVTKIAYLEDLKDTDPPKYYATIPRDDNDNMIADAWPYDGTNNDDVDASPTGANTGDGFSRFDEYRGFIAGGTHARTNPNNKDVFIYDKDSLGLGYFSDLGLTLHSIANTEWDSATRIVNFKGGNNQCGILLKDGAWHETWVGECLPDVGTPNDVTEVRIYTQQIRSLSLPNTGPEHKDVVDTDDGVITQQVVAHELAHAVSVVHHNPIDGQSACIMRYPCPSQASGVQTHFCTSNPGCKTEPALH